MRVVLLTLMLVLAGCDRFEPRQDSVTVTLPPPEAAQPQPGFSAAATPANL